MSGCYIFTGPTISIQEAAKHLDAIYLPPVSQGDLYRIALKKPKAIGIIDGYFERIPSVWHKEILWALSQGVHVYGSASMGALRAVELSQFGMRGIGLIFEAFKDGRLLNDDEVAIAHSSSDVHYRPISEALVNIRVTIGVAENSNILTSETAAKLVKISEKLFYPERNYNTIINIAVEEGISKVELKSFKDWLPTGRIDQKREDAVAMLQEMRRHLEADLEPVKTKFVFENTIYWEQLKRNAGQIHDERDKHCMPAVTEGFLEELRLEYDAPRLNEHLTARALAFYWAEKEGIVINADTLQFTIDSFRRKQKLFEPDDLDKWLIAHGLNEKEFHNIMEKEARIQAGLSKGTVWIQEHISQYLKVNGDYRKTVERALDKKGILGRYGQDNPSLSDISLPWDDLMAWFFEECSKKTPEDYQKTYALAAGFKDDDLFKKAILREYLYLSHKSCNNLQSDGLIEGVDNA